MKHATRAGLAGAIVRAALPGAIFLGGLVWAAVVAGVPQLYIGIGVLVLLGIGIFSAVSKTRSKDPPV